MLTMAISDMWQYNCGVCSRNNTYNKINHERPSIKNISENKFVASLKRNNQLSF